MKILVTGGAGFIGSNFINYMMSKYPKYGIVCLDSLTYASNLTSLDNVKNIKNFTFVKGDITNSKLVNNLFKSESFDIVINFAAESHVDRSIKNPSIFLSTNILGTQVLMDASKEFNVKRFHQISTDEVYGDLPLDRSDLQFSEDTPLSPSSPYSASKAAADLLVLAYHRSYNLPITISRCSNNYGPYQFNEKLIPLMILNALDNKPLPVYGNGENIRDWIHVNDHCRAIDDIIHKGVIGEIYNVGGNNEKSNLEVVKTILKELNKPVELITFVTDRVGHDLRYAIDGTKIKGQLGFEPNIDFNEGIKTTIKWYLDNKK